MRWLAALSPASYVNVMEQYSPAWRVGRDAKYGVIDRVPDEHELALAVGVAGEAGLFRLDVRWRDGRDGLWARLGM